MLQFNELIDGKTVSDNEFSMLYNRVDTFVILRLTASKSTDAKLTFVDTFANHPDTVETTPDKLYNVVDRDDTVEKALSASNETLFNHVVVLERDKERLSTVL